MDQQIRFYGSFCKKSIYDVSFENDGFSGVETAEGTYDRDAKKTSITWTRPLDVSADESLTLQADTSYNVFLTWVTANKDEDASKFNSQDDIRTFQSGTTNLTDMLDMPVLAAPDQPIFTKSAMMLSVI